MCGQAGKLGAAKVLTKNPRPSQVPSADATYTVNEEMRFSRPMPLGLSLPHHDCMCCPEVCSCADGRCGVRHLQAVEWALLTTGSQPWLCQSVGVGGGVNSRQATLRLCWWLVKTHWKCSGVPDVLMYMLSQRRAAMRD